MHRPPEINPKVQTKKLNIKLFVNEFGIEPDSFLLIWERLSRYCSSVSILLLWCISIPTAPLRIPTAQTRMSRTHRKTLQNRLNNRPISSNLTVFHSKHLFLSIEKAERLNARLILFLPFKSTFMPKYSLEKNNTNSNLSSGFVLFPTGGEEGIRTLVRFRANWFRLSSLPDTLRYFMRR